MRTAALALGIMLGLMGTAHAAGSNRTLNIEGVLRDAAGGLQSQAVGLAINLYDGQMAAKPFYTQSFTTVAVDNGFFAVELSGDSLSFANLADVWVGIQVSGDMAELPRQHLDAAPFAFSAGALDATLCSGCVQNGMIADVDGAKVTGKVAAAASADVLTGVLPIANGGTGSATQSFVDLTGDQTISGMKLWSSEAPLWFPVPKGGAVGKYNVTYVRNTDPLGGLFVDLGHKADTMDAPPVSFSVGQVGWGPTLVVTPNTNAGGGTVNVIGNLKYTGSIGMSDARLKRDVAPMTDMLSSVEKLRPVSYRWKADGQPGLGFIAQEVEKIFPQLVMTDERGYKGINYDKITAVLTAAFQEARVADRAALAEVRAENAALRARLDRLEGRLDRLASAR
jgi:hypothetical protein